MDRRPLTLGIYNRWFGTLGGGERYAFALADALSPLGNVELLTHSKVPLEALQDRLAITLDRVAVRQVRDTVQNVALSALTKEYDVFINASNRDLFPSRAGHSILITFFPSRSVEIIGGRRSSRALLRLSQEMLKLVRSNEYRAARQRDALAAVLSSYQSIWAISQFVQRWVRRYWGRQSELLYPPVDGDAFAAPGNAKRSIILAVGRFFPGRHNKKHIPMVRAFKTLCDGGLAGWELHLAGGCQQQPEYVRYLESVYREASGYPVLLHPNLPMGELIPLYRDSKLFWHATGFDEDESLAPERCEHFGISTVEAMAAGCVPLVTGKGGQPEVVSHGSDGFLWQRLDELAEHTMALIRNERLRAEMAAKAVLAARRFDVRHFREHVAALISDALDGRYST